MTVTTLEPVTIDHLDFDFEPTCETTMCEWGRPKATHILIAPCCEIFSCTPCAEIAEESVAYAVMLGAQLRCRHCNVVSAPHLCRIEPLA